MNSGKVITRSRQLKSHDTLKEHEVVMEKDYGSTPSLKKNPLYNN
jgi:hypothetical protein